MKLDEIYDGWYSHIPLATGGRAPDRVTYILYKEGNRQGFYRLNRDGRMATPAPYLSFDTRRGQAYRALRDARVSPRSTP